MIVRQITSLLPSPMEKLKVQVSVGLSDARGETNYCSMYTTGEFAYLNVKPIIQLTIKYFEPTRRWNRLDHVFIAQRDMAALKADFKEFYDNMLNHEDDIFTYNDSGYISSISNSNVYTRIIRVGKKQAMRLEPIALYATENGKPIPGVSIEINHRDNRVEMSINEFEMLNDIIQTIQLRQEGMILLHMYMTMCLKNGGLTIPIEEGSGGRQLNERDVTVNIFERAQSRAVVNERNEEFVSGPNPTNQPTGLEDLP